ncbi:MAG TPA: glycosyltransferase family 39 protein, partial [Candidatus Limnocylindria bacterium]|nr:glycosyltransferase family 39 protein [Candidatus Limnocylindria bacterium]
MQRRRPLTRLAAGARSLADSRAADGLLIGLAIIASAAVSLHALGAKSIHGDEAVSIETVLLPLRRFAEVVISDEPFNGLYYLLLRGWTGVWGVGEAALRSMSAILVAAAIPPLYLVGHWLDGRRGGLIVAGLAVSNAFVIHYSQDGRAYGLAYFLVAASCALVIRAVQRPSGWAWTAYAAVAILAAFAHFFAVFVLAAQLGWALLALGARRIPWPAVGAILVALAPLAVAIAQGPERRWIADAQVPAPELVLTVAGAWVEPTLSVPLAVLMGAGLVLAAIAVWSVARAGVPLAAKPELMLVAGLVVPLAGSLAISIVKPIVVSRYLIVVEPPMLLLLAVGLARARPQVLGSVLAGLTMAFGLLQVDAWYRADSNLDFRGAAQRILARSAAGDGVLILPPATFQTKALGYYLDRLPATGARPALERVEGVQDAEGRVQQLRAAHERVWLVLSSPEDEAAPAIQDWVAAFDGEFARSSADRLGSLEVLLYS